MYCIYFYAEHGIGPESFYLLEVKDLKDIPGISNNNVWHHAENPESPAPSECMCYKDHANTLGLFNIYYFLCVTTVSIFPIVGKFYIKHWSPIGIYSAWIYLKWTKFPICELLWGQLIFYREYRFGNYPRSASIWLTCNVRGYKLWS